MDCQDNEPSGTGGRKAEEEYNTALEEYEAEIASAELTLQKLQNQLETAREDFTDAEVSYQKTIPECKRLSMRRLWQRERRRRRTMIPSLPV